MTQDRKIRTFLNIAFAVVLILTANILVFSYLSAERFIYYWDLAEYWRRFGSLGELARSSPLQAFLESRFSIAVDDYNLGPLLPLIPFELVFGPGRLSYILAITNMSLLPSAALIALVAETTMAGRSWTRFLACMAAILGLHVLWAPALRGFPDVLGVAIACTVLLVYQGRALERFRLLRLAALGLLLCVLMLTRRYYIFWAVSFFPAAIIAWLASAPKAELTWAAFSRLAKDLAIVATICGSYLVLLAAPLLRRIVSTDYSAAYAAYRADLSGAGTAGQVVAHFGIALLVVGAGGLIWLAVRRETRQLGVLVIAQALLSFVLFTRVQALLGVQHYYLFVPAAGIGIAVVISALWSANIRAIWRFSGVAAVLMVILANSVAVFSHRSHFSSALFAHVRYAPMVRTDLEDVNRLLRNLAALKPGQVYVAASSHVLNWSILQNACTDIQLELCSHIAKSADIDMRDGFPVAVLDADYIVLATPSQYHVMPDDQRVIGVVARDIRDKHGIGVAFERLPNEVTLAKGVNVAIYRKVAPLPVSGVTALSEELKHYYPHAKHLFDLPASYPRN